MPKLSDLKVDEVSLCTKGMNQHARVALFKADNSDAPLDPDSAAALEKLAADFSAGILKISKGDKPPSGGNEMTDDEKAKMEAEMKDKLKKAAEAEVAAKVADLEKRLAKADAVAALSDGDKAYMAKLADDAARDAWLAKAPADRSAEIAKAQAGDESITVGGATVRKSEVGAGTFAVLKSQQEAIAKQAELLAKAAETAELATLAKSAADDYGHLPGTDMEKAHVLRSIQSLPEDVRKTTEQILKAAEATAQFAFSKRGTIAGASELAKGAGAFTKAVAEIQARDKCTKTEAMAKAIVEQPAAFEAYQAATDVPAN